MPNRQSMSIVQALLTSLCARGWSVTVNQARRPTRRFVGISLCPRFVWFTHVCQSKSGSRRVPWPRTLLKGEGAGRGRRYTLMDVRLPKIETPYVDDETGSLPVADFRESASPPPEFWLNMPRLIHSLMLWHRIRGSRVYERVSENRFARGTVPHVGREVKFTLLSESWETVANIVILVFASRTGVNLMEYRGI